MVSGLAQVSDLAPVAFHPYQKPYHNHLTFSVSPLRWTLQLYIVVSSPDLRPPQSHRLGWHAWSWFVFAMYLTSEIPIIQFSLEKFQSRMLLHFEKSQHEYDDRLSVHPAF